MRPAGGRCRSARTVQGANDRLAFALLVSSREPEYRRPMPRPAEHPSPSSPISSHRAQEGGPSVPSTLVASSVLLTRTAAAEHTSEVGQVQRVAAILSLVERRLMH